MNQDNLITLNRENVKYVVKFDNFCGFSDILDGFYKPNERIDMNPPQFCQASSD